MDGVTTGRTYTFVFGRGVDAIMGRVVDILADRTIEVSGRSSAARGRASQTYLLNPEKIIYARKELRQHDDRA